MSKNKDIVKAHSRAPRFRENTRLMRVHENMVDFLKGGPPSVNLLDVVASSFFGLDILMVDEENDLIYSDDDDDDDDDEVPRQDPYKQLQPHPRIKQLTDEEADKQAKELIEEEQRKGRKKKKNKHKKLRKKEKKRLEKENAEKNNLPEEEQEKSDSSESPEENPIVEKKTESKEESTAVSDKTVTVSGCDELSKVNNEEEEEPEKNNKDGEEATENTQLNTSYPPNTESVVEETHQYTQEIKEEKSITVEDEEEKLEETEEPEARKEEEKVHMMKDMTKDVIKEEPVDPTALEFSQRSRDLAAVGNRLAAAGQYEMAVKYFTDAIKYNPREARLFGNRSLCLERMYQYENALSDADIALTMEPNWTKGLFRKGKALCGLKKYYEASLVYKDVLKLDSSSKEAVQELKRAQTLHLMEMGFTWAQSCDALKTHETLEEAIEALFCGGHNLASGGTCGGLDSTVRRPMQEDGGAEREWTVQQTSRPRTQHAKESNSQSQPTPVPKSCTKPQVFSVWVGSMAPTITYTTLHEVFSRAGSICSIKMLLEHKCAFVNYGKKQDSDRAIQCINGMVVEGVPLLVRYPSRNHSGLGMPKWATGDPAQSGSGMYKKECFFWRTTGCTRSDCIYRHVPEHKGIDRDKFTSGLGTSST